MSGEPKDTPGVAAIRVERLRQIAMGWTAEHDDGHADHQLVDEAVALLERRDQEWGLHFKNRGDRLRQLEIAGALVAAEYDRLLREESR